MNWATFFKENIKKGNVVTVYDLESGVPMSVKVSKSYRTGEIYFYGVGDGKQIVFHWSDADSRFQGGAQE